MTVYNFFIFNLVLLTVPNKSWKDDSWFVGSCLKRTSTWTWDWEITWKETSTWTLNHWEIPLKVTSTAWKKLKAKRIQILNVVVIMQIFRSQSCERTEYRVSERMSISGTNTPIWYPVQTKVENRRFLRKTQYLGLGYTRYPGRLLRWPQ